MHKALAQAWRDLKQDGQKPYFDEYEKNKASYTQKVNEMRDSSVASAAAAAAAGGGGEGELLGRRPSALTRLGRRLRRPPRRRIPEPGEDMATRVHRLLRVTVAVMAMVVGMVMGRPVLLVMMIML